MSLRILGVAFALMLAFVSLGSAPADAFHLRRGAYANTTSALRVRTGPGTNYRITTTLPYGAHGRQVRPRNGHWYGVTYNGRSGYVHGGYLTQSGGSNGGSRTTYSSGKGAAIAATAKRYVGYRYTMYGNTPSEGFNCVGFSQWVLRQNGISVPMSLRGQYSRGSYVSRGNLQPGDIVFFQNTWWRGLSHAGVYVGNGWMVDASTPRTGVVWSNIYSSYFNNKWYGGRRIR
ncbi:MAG: NlpC/P60 family protein [Chloroflexia bacterium]